MHIFSFDQSNVLYSLATLLRLHAFSLLRFYLFAFLILSESASASGAEISMGAEPNLKKVTIRRQLKSAQDILRKETDETFFVEVVRDRRALEKGLSHRESMPEDHGMLFVLDASQEHAFWMKEMRFPLDIIFIGGDMKITEILENLQTCEQCPVYFPKKQPAYALEINAGRAAKNRLSVDDTMAFEK
jgi:uncharacterized protein